MHFNVVFYSLVINCSNAFRKKIISNYKINSNPGRHSEGNSRPNNAADNYVEGVVNPLRAENFQSNIDTNIRRKEHLATTENHQKKLEAATEKHQRKMEKYAKIDSRFQAADLGLTFAQTVQQLAMSHVLPATKSVDELSDVKGKNEMTLESKSKCLENKPEDKHCYTIVIKTADKTWAGTNAAIDIKLYHISKNATIGSITVDDIESSAYIHLNNRGDDFERGDSGTYYILGPNMGEINMINLKHKGRNDKWIIESISVDGKSFCIDETKSELKNNDESFKQKSNELCV
jgi:hypothetical protein